MFIEAKLNLVTKKGRYYIDFDMEQWKPLQHPDEHNIKNYCLRYYLYKWRDDQQKWFLTNEWLQIRDVDKIHLDVIRHRISEFENREE